jgi:hypothetical protein
VQFDDYSESELGFTNKLDAGRFPKDFFRHTWVDLPGEIVKENLRRMERALVTARSEVNCLMGEL